MKSGYKFLLGAFVISMGGMSPVEKVEFNKYCLNYKWTNIEKLMRNAFVLPILTSFCNILLLFIDS